MAEDLHHRSLRDTAHGQRAGRVVAKVVEVEISESEPPNEASKAAGHDVRISLGEHPRLRIEAAWQNSQRNSQRIVEGDRATIAVLCLPKRDEPSLQLHVGPTQPNHPPTPTPRLQPPPDANPQP